MEMKEHSNLPLWAWTVLAVLLMSQGTLLFRTARDLGRWRWFWGLWGMTTFPLPTILYLLLVVFPEYRRKQKEITEQDKKIRK
ncbi:hypothetical protein [Paenibacillus durus]|nr:hypothetical protein [Paenibacillus durus]